MKRPSLVVVALGAGILLGILLAYSRDLTTNLASLLGLDSHAETTHLSKEAGHDHVERNPADATHSDADHHGDGDHKENNSKIAMAAEQIDGAKIDVKFVEPGVISQTLRLPGTIIPDRNRAGRVPSKVVGTVVELRKGLGDTVSAGEVIAVLDSREVADAKSEYIAALVNFRLQDTLYQREKTLWEKQVSSEQRLLRAEATYQEAQVRRDVARQKLSALGVGSEAIATLSEAGQDATGLERYEIKAPISGRIVEQFVDIGTPMGNEGQAHELYAIADLSTVWVELTVSTQDLPQIEEGQSLTLQASGVDKKSTGTIIFTSPMLNQETRSARVIAAVENDDGTWRPGSFVTAEVAISASNADLVIPKSALQTIEGKIRVFVRTADGFEARDVTLGRDDGTSVEILSGLGAGDPIATANTFLLKAELGKSEAEHVH